MASNERLYPSLYPTIDVVSTLVMSSDEEQPDNKRAQTYNPSRISSGKKYVNKKEYSIHKDQPSSLLSLSDFESSYIGEQNRQYSKPPEVSRSLLQSLLVYSKNTVTILRKWKMIIIGVVLAFVVIISMDEGMGKDNYLPCTSDILQPCIKDSDQDMIVAMARKVRDILHVRAGAHDCSKIPTQRGLTIDYLRHIPQDWDDVDFSDNDVNNILYLFLFNKHWGIRVYGSDDSMIGVDGVESINNECTIESTRPIRSLSCCVKGWFRLAWQKIRLIALITTVFTSIILFIRYYIHRKRTEEAAVYLMVDRITNLLQAHYHKSQKNKDILPYLAIAHVRDGLVLPSERHKNQVVWDKAVKWISTKESRVRQETRRISGEDLPVWKWIYNCEPLPTEEPDSMWSGKALEDYPPGLESKMAPPVGTPSICIRVKNMFESVKKMDSSQVKDIRNAIIRKCHSCGDVVHLYVDKRSAYGCVYFKMDSLNNAIQAYKTLHGSWFGSRLVTAKYIPEHKYHKWFTHAVEAKVPLSVDK